MDSTHSMDSVVKRDARPIEPLQVSVAVIGVATQMLQPMRMWQMIQSHAQPTLVESA